MYLRDGIDLQKIALGVPVYDSTLNEWFVLHLESDTTDYTDMLISKFNDTTSEYYGSGCFMGYLKSTGEIIRYYGVYK